MLHIVGDRIYSVNILRINYTTYDVHRDYDVINPRTQPDIMIESPDASPSAWPYWYARVLRIFHLQVWTTHPELNDPSPREMKVLWVRWLGQVPGYRWGFKRARLPKVGFVPSTDEDSFSFLDPACVIRGCHLIPTFSEGRTSELLPVSHSAARINPDETDDWVNFYVSM